MGKKYVQVNMNHFFLSLGWMFLALAFFYLLGLLPAFARRFYPTMPGVAKRAAAPVIFACLAVACFCGAGFQAMLTLTVVGIVLIVINRRNGQKQQIRI